MEVLVAQSCQNPSEPMDCSLPGLSVNGNLQARILDWVSLPFFRESSWPRGQTPVSCTPGRFFTAWATKKALLLLLLLLLSRFSHVLLCATPWTAAHQAPPSLGWTSPGKNTGVGCHFLLQCMKVKRESEVAQSCPTPSDPMDCSLPGSSAHGIFQARVLEWGAIAFS